MTKTLLARFERVTLRDFKSYREATLHLAPLTLLVGANASGKSNAIEAIRILAWLARGQRLDAITSSVQTSDVGIRGGCRIWSSKMSTALRLVAR